MAARLKSLGGQDRPLPQAAAIEVSRQIGPLIELAQENGLTFLAYLLSMAMEEARRIAMRPPEQQEHK